MRSTTRHIVRRWIPITSSTTTISAMRRIVLMLLIDLGAQACAFKQFRRRIGLVRAWRNRRAITSGLSSKRRAAQSQRS
jgi:hypothetical protein